MAVVVLLSLAGEAVGLQKNTLLLGCVAATAAYFAAAFWLQMSYDPQIAKIAPSVDGEKVLLHRPFRGFLDSKFAAIANDTRFRDIADTADNNLRSDIELYEDGRLLGPAHSVHADVGNIGQGRFSHWRYNYSIFLFSSSDNTDPNTNGRNYWAVKRGGR